MQIIAQEVPVITSTPGVEKPIRPSRAQMHSGARAGIKHGKFRARLRRPMGAFNISVSAGQLCKNLDQAENHLSKTPVCVVENERKRGRKYRGQQRNQAERKKAECDR